MLDLLKAALVRSVVSSLQILMVLLVILPIAIPYLNTEPYTDTLNPLNPLNPKPPDPNFSSDLLTVTVEHRLGSRSGSELAKHSKLTITHRNSKSQTHSRWQKPANVKKQTENTRTQQTWALQTLCNRFCLTGSRIYTVYTLNTNACSTQKAPFHPPHPIPETHLFTRLCTG